MTPEEIVKRLRVKQVAIVHYWRLAMSVINGLTAEDIVKRLRHRRNESWAAVMEQAAYIIEQHLDEVKHWEESYKALTAIIEQQAKELSVCQRHRAQLFDDLHGTPCEQIRHAQEVEELKKALDEAEKAIGPFAFPTTTWGAGVYKMELWVATEWVESARAALATIRAARGGKEDD